MSLPTDHAQDLGEKLIRMAVQIADFYSAYPEPEALAAVSGHINKFWTPKMREEFLAATESEQEKLSPLLRAARAAVKRRKIE